MQAWLHLTYEDEDDAMLLFIRKGVYLGLEGRNVDGEGIFFPSNWTSLPRTAPSLATNKGDTTQDGC